MSGFWGIPVGTPRIGLILYKKKDKKKLTFVPYGFNLVSVFHKAVSAVHGSALSGLERYFAFFAAV